MCGKRTGTEHTHHIERRSAAPARYDHPCNWFWVCLACHATLHRYECHPRQLAYKLVNDAENFNLHDWLLLRTPMERDSKRVTMADIAVHLVVKIIDGCGRERG